MKNAEKFANSTEFVPLWANEDNEEELAEAVDKNKEQQDIKIQKAGLLTSKKAMQISRVLGFVCRIQFSLSSFLIVFRFVQHRQRSRLVQSP